MVLKNEYDEKLFLAGVNILSLPLIIPLAIIQRIFRVKFWRMRGSRIGHLAANSDFFLRRLQLEEERGKKVMVKPVIIATTTVANKQLFQMYTRIFTIYRIPQSKLMRAISKRMASHSWLAKLGLFEQLPFLDNGYEVWNNSVPSLKFTKEEEQRGADLLQSIGVNSWFVCFHARDQSYLNQQWEKGDSYHQFRNCSIDNFLAAAEYVSREGGFALRMGSVVEKKIECADPHIIDYATRYRTDFGDIYLTAHCTFFVGNTAGLVCVAYAFNLPLVMTNVIPLGQPPPCKNHIFLPKKIWSEKEQRFLTFKEMVELDLRIFYHGEAYAAAGYTPIENTAHEILSATMEMHQRLQGTWKTTAEDEQRQLRFKSLFKPGHYSYGFPSRIGTAFLRENQHLL